MTIYLNNESVEITPSQTVSELLTLRGLIETGGLAVAVNGNVLPREKWVEKTLSENDQIIIITATAGG